MGTNQKTKSLLFAIFFLFLSPAAHSQGIYPRPNILIRLNPQASNVSKKKGLRIQISPDLPPLIEVQYLPLTKTHVLELPDQADLEGTLKTLRNNPDYTVEKDEVLYAHSAPDDEFFDLQWALSTLPGNIGVQTAWDFNTSASPILIAVIDSGCDLSHEDLESNFWKNPSEIADNGIDEDQNGYVDDVQGYNFVNRAPLPLDDFGHGTMVSGILGATGNNQKGIAGISWNSQIMCLKALDAHGESSISKAIEAIDYALAKQAKVINMSWGYTPHNAPSALLEEAIQKAQEAGVLIVASAGNGQDTVRGDDNDVNVNEANYPSSYPQDNIIAVAAIDQKDELAAFSNYGSVSVDLAAPGENILSTYPDNHYQYISGTSASAPHVTGAAALLWAANPDLNYFQIKQILIEHVDPLASLQGRIFSGGRLNLGSALLNSPAQGGPLPSGTPPPRPIPAPPAAQTGCSLSDASDSTAPSVLILFFPFLLFFYLKNRRPLSLAH